MTMSPNQKSSLKLSYLAFEAWALKVKTFSFSQFFKKKTEEKVNELLFVLLLILVLDVRHVQHVPELLKSVFIRFLLKN